MSIKKPEEKELCEGINCVELIKGKSYNANMERNAEGKWICMKCKKLIED